MLKEKFYKNMIKNFKGITLMSLVITIIVLLILTGVGLGMIQGNNGTINQAINAKTESDKKEIQEKIQLAYVKSTDKYGDISNDKLKEELSKSIKGNIILKQSGEALIVLLDDYTAIIDEDGNIVVMGLSDREVISNVLNCSCDYILSIESEVYTGEATLRVYSRDKENYKGKITIANGESHSWKIRDILNNSIEVEEDDKAIDIEYTGTNTSGNISIDYDNTKIQGEVKATVIRAIDKERIYTRLGNLLLKILNEDEVSQEELKGFVDYAITERDQSAAYTFLNQIGSDGVYDTIKNYVKTCSNQVEQKTFDKELDTRNLESVKREDISPFIQAICDQVKICVSGEVGTFSIVLKEKDIDNIDIYTAIDYIEEDDILRKFHTLNIGNAIIPFTVNYLKEVSAELKSGVRYDINDPSTKSSENCADFAYLYNCGDLPGLWSKIVINAYIATNGNIINASDETKDVYSNAKSACGLFWLYVFSIYQDKELVSTYGFELSDLGKAYDDQIRDDLFEQIKNNS